MGMTNVMDNRTATFQRHRSRLYGIAYRRLGTGADAEHMLQEAYLRWHRTDAERVQVPEAWLTTTVTRLCIDRLRAARTEREAYVEPGLLMCVDGRPVSVISIGTDGLRILAVYAVLNPEKLKGIAPSTLCGG